MEAGAHFKSVFSTGAITNEESDTAIGTLDKGCAETEASAPPLM